MRPRKAALHSAARFGRPGIDLPANAYDAEYFGRRRLLLQRFGKIIGALAQLVQEPRILYGDDSLAGKARYQSYLLVSERTNLLAVYGERTDQFILLQHRNCQRRPRASKFDGSNGAGIAPVNVARRLRSIANMNRRLRHQHASIGLSD